MTRESYVLLLFSLQIWRDHRMYDLYWEATGEKHLDQSESA